MVLADSHRISRVPWYSGNLPKKAVLFRLQDCYLLWLAVPSYSARRQLCNFSASLQLSLVNPYNPAIATPAGFNTYSSLGSIPFRSPLLRESQSAKGGHICFLFLKVLRCFSSLGCSLHPMCSDADNPTWLGLGFPIRKSPDKQLFAPTRGLSQLTTSFVDSWCQGIHRMPLLT